MGKTPIFSNSMLRQKAEEIMEKKSAKSEQLYSEADRLKLIHELQVHQIELELQNEELILAKEMAESATEKYIELYDFAPSGYLTLNSEGKIEDSNFAGATMLGRDRSRLMNREFLLFITENSRTVFTDFFREVHKSKVKKTCEVVLLKDGISPVYVHIDGIRTGDHWYLTLVDITERKHAEELLKKSNDLEQMNNYLIDRELKMIELKKEINELLKKLGLQEKYIIHT